MSSSIPAAVNGFTGIVTTAVGAECDVYFGQPQEVYVSPKRLRITGVRDIRQEPAEIGPNYKREETYILECEIASIAGGDDFAGRMDECFDIFEKVTTAVAVNYTLGGAVRFAQVTEGEYIPDRDPNGQTLGILQFGIDCQQRITSLT
jgi:hypothetical protein